MNRVLTVNLNYLGDVLFTTAAVAALRNRHDLGPIDTVVSARGESVLRGNPDIGRVFLRPGGGKIARALHLSRVLRSGEYDTVVLFHSTLATASIARFHGVPRRIGFCVEGAGAFLTDRIAPRAPGEHHVDAFLRLVSGRDAGGAGHDIRLSIAPSADDRTFARRFLSESGRTGPWVGLCIGATRPQKRWPEPHFARLCDRLESCGVACVLLGGSEDIGRAEQISRLARRPIVSAVGATSVTQLAALCERLSAVVSGDSGPMHIASAMRAPVVALFGSTDPAESGPWRNPRATVLYDNPACGPCRKSPTCGGRHDCLENIRPERVLETLLAIPGLATTRVWHPLSTVQG